MFTVLQDERIFRYIPDTRYAAVEQLEERYRYLEKGSPDRREKWLNWCVFCQDDGRAIGYLQCTISVDDRVAWIAYVFSVDVWGQGYATEAVSWLLAYLETTHIVDVFRAQIDVRNSASIALVERLRFARASVVSEDGSVSFIYEKSASGKDSMAHD